MEICETRPYVLGIDPGISELGMTWMNRTTGVLEVYKMSITKYLEPDFEYKTTPDFLMYISEIICSRYSDLFNQTSLCGIEQMNHPKADKKVKLFSFILGFTIRSKFRHMTVSFINPVLVRSFFRIEASTKYTERKANGKDFVNSIVGSGNRLRLEHAYGNTADAHDSIMIAMYITMTPPPTLKISRSPRENGPHGHKHISLTLPDTFREQLTDATLKNKRTIKRKQTKVPGKKGQTKKQRISKEND